MAACNKTVYNKHGKTVNLSDVWQSSFWKTTKQLVFFRQLCYFYHILLKIKHNILSKILCPYYRQTAKNKNVKKEPYSFGLLYVSLTTYPARIKDSYFSICSLLSQSWLPNKIILTLTLEEFPSKERDLPQEILSLLDKGVEILWAKENLKPHNKYFYSMQKYPDVTIITADDDILYPRNTIKKLIRSYESHPKAVSALCTNKIFFKDGKLLPYSQSASCYDKYTNEPRFDLSAEGFAGVLYPPHILPTETFNKKQIKKCSPLADDLWLKAMELLKKIPVVCAAKYQDPPMIHDVQRFGLFNQNSVQGQNDTQLEKIIMEYKDKGILDCLN